MVMVKETAWKWIDDHHDQLTEISDKVWGYAELGLVETKSSKLITEVLERHGFDVQLGVAGMPTAIYATWGKGEPTIGFQGEYDALPGISNKVKPKKDPLVPGAPGHSWAFVACAGSTIGHKSLVFAAKAMAGAALEALTDENLRNAFKKEHKERLKGRTYKTPLPEGLQPPLEIARENWEKIPKQ